MVNPNANDSTTKRKAGRDSSRLKTRESPRHNTHHRGVSVSRDSRTDEVCERMPLLRILTCLLGFYAEAHILADHQPMDSTLLVGNRSRVEDAQFFCGNMRLTSFERCTRLLAFSGSGQSS